MITQTVVVDSVTVTVPVGTDPEYSGLTVAVRSSAGSSSKATFLCESTRVVFVLAVVTENAIGVARDESSSASPG